MRLVHSLKHIIRALVQSQAFSFDIYMKKELWECFVFKASFIVSCILPYTCIEVNSIWKIMVFCIFYPWKQYFKATVVLIWVKLIHISVYTIWLRKNIIILNMGFLCQRLAFSFVKQSMHVNYWDRNSSCDITIFKINIFLGFRGKCF